MKQFNFILQERALNSKASFIYGTQEIGLKRQINEKDV